MEWRCVRAQGGAALAPRVDSSCDRRASALSLFATLAAISGMSDAGLCFSSSPLLPLAALRGGILSARRRPRGVEWCRVCGGARWVASSSVSVLVRCAVRSRAGAGTMLDAAPALSRVLIRAGKPGFAEQSRAAHRTHTATVHHSILNHAHRTPCPLPRSACAPCPACCARPAKRFAQRAI